MMYFHTIPVSLKRGEKGLTSIRKLNFHTPLVSLKLGRCNEKESPKRVSTLP